LQLPSQVPLQVVWHVVLHEPLQVPLQVVEQVYLHPLQLAFTTFGMLLTSAIPAKIGNAFFAVFLKNSLLERISSVLFFSFIDLNQLNICF
jgi:hypothetical protein